MYSLCMSPLATSLAFSTKLVNLPIKDELATDHVVYSLLLVNNFERPCFKQTEHFTLSRVHELHAMLTVPRLPERLSPPLPSPPGGVYDLSPDGGLV